MTTRHKAAMGAAFSVLLSLVLVGCSKTQFEREHDAAVKDNPWGVELHIKLADEQRKFRAGETVRFQEFYSSQEPRMWQLEVLDTANPSDVSNFAFLSDGTATLKQPYAVADVSCCKYRFVLLDTVPVHLPYPFEPGVARYHSIVMPEKPGKYQVYVQTHRLAMRKGDGLDPATHTGYPLTSSEVLWIEVVPAGHVQAASSGAY